MIGVSLHRVHTLILTVTAIPVDLCGALPGHPGARAPQDVLPVLRADRQQERVAVAREISRDFAPWTFRTFSGSCRVEAGNFRPTRLADGSEYDACFRARRSPAMAVVSGTHLRRGRVERRGATAAAYLILAPSADPRQVAALLFTARSISMVPARRAALPVHAETGGASAARRARGSGRPSPQAPHALVQRAGAEAGARALARPTPHAHHDPPGRMAIGPGRQGPGSPFF